MATQTLVAKQGDTLDSLLWRDAGIGPAGVGPALAENPGIADLGPVLPAGTKITVTSSPVNTSQKRTIVQLWD